MQKSVIRSCRSAGGATTEGRQRSKPRGVRLPFPGNQVFGGIAVALAFWAPAAYGFWDLCSNYSNPSYEAHENMVKDFTTDTCLRLTDGICYTCIASTELEPGDPDRDYIHCAEDQPGNSGVCERYESWQELQQELNDRTRHRTQ